MNGKPVSGKTVSSNIDEHLNGEWKRTSLDFPYSNHAEAMNKVQAFFVEETRLGIPADLTNEGIRGLKHEKVHLLPRPDRTGLYLG